MVYFSPRARKEKRSQGAKSAGAGSRPRFNISAPAVELPWFGDVSATVAPWTALSVVRVITGQSSLTISATPVGAVSQRLIPTGERSGLQTHARDDGKYFVVRADEKLTVFVELESNHLCLR
jgi:hypothetical protein